MTDELQPTELGDVCVTHGGTFTGSFTDALPAEDLWKYSIDDDAHEAICDQVLEGFDTPSDSCRFVRQ